MCRSTHHLVSVIDSRFRVLSGDVDFGQNKDELRRVSVGEEEQATIVVIGGRQTAIVETGSRIVLDFNGFLRNASEQMFVGVPLKNISITVSLQRLDRSGRPVPGEPVVLLPTIGTGNRVIVSVDRESEQYFVSIGGVTRFDSGVYIVELCHHKGMVEETCVDANSTLFVLEDCECLIFFKRINLPSFCIFQCFLSLLSALKTPPMTPSLFPALPTMERSAGLAAAMTMAPLWRNVV